MFSFSIQKQPTQKIDKMFTQTKKKKNLHLKLQLNLAVRTYRPANYILNVNS